MPDYSKANAALHRLTEEQHRVTQEGGTEPAYRNEFWNHHEDGIYVDVVSGQPLFSSTDKYNSGTGWPSFTNPITPDAVHREVDTTFGMTRVEARSSGADSHLGHIFDDGPQQHGGERYCMNSAALRFVPAAELAGSEYAEFAHLFQHDDTDKQGENR